MTNFSFKVNETSFMFNFEATDKQFAKLVHAFKRGVNMLPEEMHARFKFTDVKIYRMDQIRDIPIENNNYAVAAFTGLVANAFVPFISSSSKEDKTGIILPLAYDYMSEKTLAKIIAHELVHVDQLRTGRMSVYIQDDILYKEWNGEVIGKYAESEQITHDGEFDSPWEKEAYTIATPKVGPIEAFKVTFAHAFRVGKMGFRLPCYALSAVVRK